MDKIGDTISRAGSIFRDLFNYFIPSIPVIILAVPLMENIGLLNLSSMKAHLTFLDQPIIKETTLIVIIYMVGRFLNVLSYPLFSLYDKTIGKLNISWVKENKAAYEEVKGLNDYALYVKALAKGADVFNLLFERNTIISMSERSLGTGAFIIGVLLILSYILPLPSPDSARLLSPLLLIIYCVFSFIMSFLFYFMSIGTATELHYAAKVAKDL